MIRSVQTDERRVRMSEDKWRRMRDQCRRVKTNQRQTREEYRWVKTNVRLVQTRLNNWEMSAILSFMNPESPTVFTLKRTGKFEIKFCVEDFVLCVLIYSSIIHNANARFTEKLDFHQCDMPYHLIFCALVQCVRI